MTTDATDSPSLYARVLDSAWRQLDQPVRAAHLDESNGHLWATGQFRIRHGRNRLARCLLRLFRLPAETDAVEVNLAVEREGRGETWRRAFGPRQMVTWQQEVGGLLSERFGLLELRFRLLADGGALVYRQVGARLRLGWLSFPLPGRLAPRVSAREEAAGDDRTRVTVEVGFPPIGPLISYGGEMQWRSAL